MSIINPFNTFNEETLSPEQFLKLTPSDRANIAHTKIIPPRLGKNGFGMIKVHYKRPMYKNFTIRD